MANCQQCGGLLKFSIEKQKLYCTSCSTYTDPYQDDTVNQAEESTYETTVFTCPQCGGELYGTDHNLSGNCSFCGSPVVFTSKMVREKKPDCIIPFGITKDECIINYIESLKKNPFAPSELKDPEFVEGFRGIYVPYWIYNVEQDGQFSVKGTHTVNHGSYSIIYTDQISGQNDSYYRHIMHDASSVLHDDLSEKLEPFETVPNRDIHRRTPAFQKFSPAFFSGFYAEPADVPADTYDDYARSVAEERTAQYIKNHASLKKYGLKLSGEQLNTRVNKSSLAMMPVWFLSYRKRDRVAYAAVNGQTGRVISDTPIDMKKFAVHFIIAAVIAFILLNIFTALPVSVTMLSVVMAYIVTRYCHDDIKVLKGRDADAKRGRLRKIFGSSGWTFGLFVTFLVFIIGFKIFCVFESDMVTAVNAGTFTLLSAVFNIIHIITAIVLFTDLGKINDEKPAAFVICPLMNLGAAVFSGFVLLAAPVQDWKYYLAGGIAIAVELASFAMVISNYNRVATRPLPQFSIHKGGDDNA